MEELFAAVTFDSPARAAIAALGCVGIVGSFVYFPLRAISSKLWVWQRLLAASLATLGIGAFAWITYQATEFEPAVNFLQTEAFSWFAIAGITTLLVGAIFGQIKHRPPATPKTAVETRSDSLLEPFTAPQAPADGEPVRESDLAIPFVPPSVAPPLIYTKPLLEPALADDALVEAIGESDSTIPFIPPSFAPPLDKKNKTPPA